MRRGLWFVAGAGAGIYAVVRGRRAAEALTVDGLQDRLNGLAVGVRMFRDEVAQGKVAKEAELRERLALTPHGRPELEPGGPAAGTAAGSNDHTTGHTTGHATGHPTGHSTEDEEGRG